MGLTRIFDEEDRPFLARKASLTTLKNLFFGKRLFLTLLFFGSSFANNLRLSESGRVSSQAKVTTCLSEKKNRLSLDVVQSELNN